MTASPERRPAHVLLVEDDPDTREALLDAIEELGVAVSAAENGIQAMTLLRQGPRPAAVFLDNWMPELDGAGVLARMRADASLAAIPVVWMSADLRQPPVGTLVLQKPVGTADLVAILKQLAEGAAEPARGSPDGGQAPPGAFTDQRS